MVFICSIDNNRIYPREMFKRKGQTAQFTCITDPQEEIEWYFQSGILPANAVVIPSNQSVLDITNIIEGNSGYYECIGVVQARSRSFTFSASAILIVQGKQFNTSGLYYNDIIESERA